MNEAQGDIMLNRGLAEIHMLDKQVCISDQILNSCEITVIAHQFDNDMSSDQ